jgi:hypothetical protein
VPPLNPQGYAAALRWSSRHRVVIMRVPLRIALLAAIAVTSLASAAESVEFKLDVYCHNDIADGGGYSVQIRPGSSAETARVSVGADSRGVHFIETYDVSVRPSGSGTLFQNRHLTLMWAKGARALTAESNMTRLSRPSMVAAPSKTVWDAALYKRAASSALTQVPIVLVAYLFVRREGRRMSR